MVLIFTALLSLSQLIANLPTIADFQNKPKAQLVVMYSDVCLRYLAGPLNGIDVPSLFQGSGEKQFSQSMKLAQVQVLFTKICKKDPDLGALDEFAQDIKEAEEKYIQLRKDLPNISGIRQIKLPQATDLKGADGTVIGEIYEKNSRRKWISLKDLPVYVPATFVAVEDRRFYEHKGVDELGILRALVKNSLSSGRPQGASTITQQVARNLFLDDSLSVERKVKEIILAGEIETKLSKKEILELYLNLIYFGRNSWGVEKAAQSYFGKSAANLTIVETGFLVGLVHAPNLYQSKGPRTIERLNFVMNKMVEEKVIPSFDPAGIMDSFTLLKDKTDTQLGYFKDYLLEELKSKGMTTAGLNTPSIQTTIDPKFQRSAEYFLQEGLINYEKASGKYVWRGAIGNIVNNITKDTEVFNKNKEIKDLETSKMKESLFSVTPEKAPTGQTAKQYPGWHTSLSRALPRISVPVETWQVGVVLENLTTVGLPDGSIGKISSESQRWAAGLSHGDLVYVVKKKTGDFEIQQAPEINGAVTILNAHTGQILAMVGGFNYSSGPWNRAVRALRQPGSTIKPWTYMAALQLGYQPNILLSPKPITFPPTARGGQSWTPKNYENTTSSPKPFRWALEQSYNIMTASLMGKIGLAPIRLLTKEFGIYENPQENYPLILGAQETNLISMVRAYSAIANNGFLISPHGSLLAESNGIMKEKIKSVDDVTLFQIRYLMQGVLERGTAKRIADLAPFVAGKTGTSQDFKDVWFLGFTTDIAVGVFVGYDQPTTLNKDFTGGAVALPIFEKIIRANYTEKKLQAFPGSPPGVVFYPTDLNTGEIQAVPSATTIQEAYRATRVPIKK